MAVEGFLTLAANRNILALPGGPSLVFAKEANRIQGGFRFPP